MTGSISAVQPHRRLFESALLLLLLNGFLAVWLHGGVDPATALRMWRCWGGR